MIFDDKFKQDTEACFPNSPTTLVIFPSVIDRCFSDLQRGNDKLRMFNVAFRMCRDSALLLLISKKKKRKMTSQFHLLIYYIFEFNIQK